MRQVLIRSGKVVLADVPASTVEPGCVLVEVAYSLISAGTETQVIANSGKPLLKRAFEQPEQVRQTLASVRSQGVQKTVAKVRGKLGSGSPVGYSCAGTVLQAGVGVTQFRQGDKVACAGGGFATHAEIVSVPRNLVTKVPAGCSLRDAASVTLGAIAMQGMRRADPHLGDVVAVIGLGLLGQLTVQLLVAAGCRVVGIDLDERRVQLALDAGAERTFVAGTANVSDEIAQLTHGHGADVTIVTAAASDDAIVQEAMEITRRKGRVVVVGDVGLGLKRSPFYEREIDFLISCSYGPGRYDACYEERGLDYPYAYVRWTENRNMSEYLRLVASGKVQLGHILEREYDIEQAPQAYEALGMETDRPLGVVLAYIPRDAQPPEASAKKLSSKVAVQPGLRDGKINLAVVGAGSFAKGVLLPNLQQLSGLFHLRAVVSGGGANAHATAQQYAADYASTNYEDVVSDPDVQAIVIATRHDLHARAVIASLRAGKHVFCEKPLALNMAELDEIAASYGDMSISQPMLMVGFNRRFSPAAQRVKEITATRQNPMMVLYRVNAGYIGSDNWVQGPEGGGRIIGEACHMLDLFRYWTGAPVRSVNVEAVGPLTEHVQRSDNVSVTTTYDDGSVCTLIYTALGASQLGKEYIEVYADGKAMVIDDFKTLHTYGLKRGDWNGLMPDKGHKQALEAFGLALKSGGPGPIAMSELMETSRLVITVNEMLGSL